MTDLLTEKNANIDTARSPTFRFQPLPPVHYVFATEEDRCAIRHKVTIPARLRFSCAQSFEVVVSDISLAGFNCDALLQVHAGTRCWITMPGLGSLEAEAVRHDNRGLGCAFGVLLNPAVLDRLIADYSDNS